MENIMRKNAQLVSQNAAKTRVGTVSAYDPNAHAVKILFQPDNTESGWLPVFTPWVGNGWGMFSPPSIGDMAKVHFQEGGHEAGMVSLRGFNDVDRPLPVPSGEFWLVHKTGSSIKITNDGAISIHTNQNLNATVTGNANLSVTGPVTASAQQWNITGDINLTGNLTATGDVHAANIP